jgi:hypothetical protein
MSGIVGNDMHYDREPSLEEFVADMARMQDVINLVAAWLLGRIGSPAP